MRKIAFALALVTVTPAAAVDVMFNTPLDTTPATLILAAKALGVWNTISNQIIEDQIDAYGNHWSLYVAGNGVCPGVTGYVAFMRYLGSPFSSGMTPPGADKQYRDWRHNGRPGHSLGWDRPLGQAP